MNKILGSRLWKGTLILKHLGLPRKSAASTSLPGTALHGAEYLALSTHAGDCNQALRLFHPDGADDADEFSNFLFGF